MDMMSEDPIAEYILDAVTEQSVCRAVSYARAGADFLFLGDDIGMQRTPMMSTELPDEGVVAGYGNRIRAKYTAKWGVQIVEMIFQTRSRGKRYFAPT